MWAVVAFLPLGAFVSERTCDMVKYLSPSFPSSKQLFSYRRRTNDLSEERFQAQFPWRRQNVQTVDIKPQRKKERSA